MKSTFIHTLFNDNPLKNITQFYLSFMYCAEPTRIQRSVPYSFYRKRMY
jgi:hypothetical protein